MPLLTKSGRVVVVGVDEGGGGEALLRALHHVVREVAWNGVAADAHVLARDRGTTADALFAAGRRVAQPLSRPGAYILAVPRPRAALAANLLGTLV